MNKPPVSALLYSYANKYGSTPEGAVLAAEPYCANVAHVSLARMVLVTDNGLGAVDAINALGFALEPGPLAPECLPICNALIRGQYATAVREAQRLGILR